MSGKKKKKQNNIFKNPLMIFLILSIISTVILNSFLSFLTSPVREEVSYSEFLALDKEGKVERDEFTGNYIEINEKTQE